MPWWWQIIVSHGEKQAAYGRQFYIDYKAIQLFGRLAKRLKGRMLPGLWQGGGADKMYHPWGQPLDEAERLIEDLTDPGDLVCDPFAGGGTVPVAAMRLGRRCVAMEKDPESHKVAMDRLISESKVRRRGFRVQRPQGYIPPSRDELIGSLIETFGPRLVLVEPAPRPKL